MVSNKKIITTHKAVPPTGHSLLKLNIIMKKSLYLFCYCDLLPFALSSDRYRSIL